VVALAVVALVGMLGFMWLVQLERAGRGHVVVAVVVAELVVEGILYGYQGAVPQGSLFYPGAGGLRFRIPELLIPLALLARAVTRQRPRAMTATGLWLMAYCAWLVAETYVGLKGGNDTTTALFQAKQVLYLGGGYLLVAGSSAAPLLRPGVIRRWIAVLSLVAVGFVGLTVVGHGLRFSVPGIRYVEANLVSSDLASLLLVVGLIGLLVEMAERRPRLPTVVGSLWLMAMPLFSQKRAPVLSLAVAAAALGLAGFGRTWRRRIKLPMLHLLGIVVLTVAAAAAVAIGVVGFGGRNLFEARVQATFTGSQQKASSTARLSLGEEAVTLIGQRPLIGWGLGKRVVQVTPGLPPFPASPHNLVLDLLLVAGLPGLVLFAGVVVSAARIGLRDWASPRVDDRRAAASLAAVLGVATLVTKAMVEPLLEEFKLVTMLGLLLGLIAGLARLGLRPKLEHRIEAAALDQAAAGGR